VPRKKAVGNSLKKTNSEKAADARGIKVKYANTSFSVFVLSS
jgi:hypothetical protein